MPQRSPGFTLVEVILATAVGLVLMGGTIYAYRAAKSGSSLSQARSIVGTVQTNIGMEKFRLGSPPPMTPAPSASVTASVATNMDSTGKPYWAGGVVANQLPQDPVKGVTGVLSYDSTQSPVPLVSNAPSAQWDNPIFLSSASPSPGYGKGGWLYDPATGAFRINLSNQDYPEERPGSW